MCQNNLESWRSIASGNPFKKPNCNPSEQSYSQPYQHYQRQLAKLYSNEIDSYCLLLQGRMNNKHPYVCNVLSFQLLPQKLCQNLNSKQMGQVLVWTDIMIPLLETDWTKENVVKMLSGLKRLAMIYGAFEIGSQQINKNENDEIKVWISKMPEKCKIDAPAASQKDMLKNVALLVQKRNIELAYLLNAARTLRQAIDSINSMFVYQSQDKYYKTADFAEFKTSELSDFKNKNLQSACTTSLYPNKSLKTPQYANKNFVNHVQFPKSAKNSNKQKFFFPSYNSTFNSTTMTRPQSRVYNPFFHQPVQKNENYSKMPNESTKYHFIPNNSNQPSRTNSRHLTFTPMNKFGSNTSGQAFSHRLGSDRVPDEGETNNHINNFDITIINNNVSNYINNFSGNKSSKGSSSPMYKHPFFNSNKAKSQGKASKNTSFWLNSSKLSKAKSNVPYYFALKKKPQSSHQQYTLDSMEDSAPQFTRNTTESVKMDNFEAQSSGRKDKKLYTFCTPKNPNYQPLQRRFNIPTPKDSQTQANQPNFFKKTTPSNSYNRSNTTQFFPSNKEKVNNNKTMDIWSSQPRQKRFNSFAVDIKHEQQFSQKIPTTKSVGIDQNSSTSSKKIQMKKQLKMEFGNLFNIAEANQSPRCSYSQKLNSGPLVDSQSKTELMKESILKQKIKQKNQAFAELKKEALKVLTDF